MAPFPTMTFPYTWEVFDEKTEAYVFEALNAFPEPFRAPTIQWVRRPNPCASPESRLCPEQHREHLMRQSVKESEPRSPHRRGIR